MRHWHQGDNDVPLVFEKERVSRQNARAREAEAVVRIQPGAGDYEDKFRFYWLVVAWSLFAYNCVAMLILLIHMAMLGSVYQWLPHLVGTVIIILATGMVACIYRFILFPPPGYYGLSPMDLAALAPHIFTEQPRQEPEEETYNADVKANPAAVVPARKVASG